MAGITDSQGNRLIDFHYEGYGAGYYTSYDTEKAALLAQINPFGYRSYVMDLGTGFYYLQSRYYDPTLGRFINADGLVSTGQGLVGNNMFAYCNNNPVHYADVSGYVPEDVAKKLIQENAEFIKQAGEEFNVDPVIIAGCIYAEQVLNVDWKDSLFDVPLSFIDTSIGIGQVKVSTAATLEKLGYIERTPRLPYLLSGVLLYSPISVRLTNNKTNIRYTAAYLKYWQDVWSDTLDISKMPGILGTLYNLGSNANTPNKSPKPNYFGIFVEENYKLLKELLG